MIDADPLLSSAAARLARACLLIAAIGACSPGSFDAFVGRGERDASAEGGRSEDASARDAATRDGAIVPSIEAGPMDGRVPGQDPDGTTPSLDTGSPPEDAGGGGCPHATDPDTVVVATTELGTITIPSVDQPRAGPGVRVGNRVMWAFAYLAEFSTPFAVWTGSDVTLSAPPALQAPEPLVPLIPDGAVPAGYSAGLGSAVPLSDTHALLYFSAFGLFIMGDVGLDRVAIDAPQAEVLHPVGQFFPRPDPIGDAGAPPWFPIFHTGGFAHTEPGGVYVYVYACNADPDAPSEQPGALNEGPCRLARVRLEEAEDSASYEYWNGRGWVGNVGSARIVITHVPNQLSVSYNRYLEKFLAVHTAGSSNQIALRWADRPEGPWHPLDEFETQQATAAFGYTLAGQEQVALRDECHAVVYVTYVLPRATMDDNGARVDVFETQLVRVTLQ